jgi:hypothetical protein
MPTRVIGPVMGRHWLTSVIANAPDAANAEESYCTSSLFFQKMPEANYKSSLFRLI